MAQAALFGDAGDGAAATAVFSVCRRYRYTLSRRWGPGRQAMFVGLNPSTADETQDDPTIRRCVAYAKAWGFDGLLMGNLFAFRATDPEAMLKCADPVGEDTDSWLRIMAKEAGIVIAAWGALGGHRGRDQDVRSLMSELHYLKLTANGQPGHPLYLRKDLKPVRWVQKSRD